MPALATRLILCAATMGINAASAAQQGPTPDQIRRLAQLPRCVPLPKVVLNPIDRARRSGKDEHAAADSVRRFAEMFSQSKCEARKQ